MRMKTLTTHVCNARKETEHRETIGKRSIKSSERAYLSESYAILSGIQ